MRWSEVYDSDKDEVQRLQDEVDVLRSKVEAVQSIANGLGEYLARASAGPRTQALGVIYGDLVKALGDTEPDHG